MNDIRPPKRSKPVSINVRVGGTSQAKAPAKKQLIIKRNDQPVDEPEELTHDDMIEAIQKDLALDQTTEAQADDSVPATENEVVEVSEAPVVDANNSEDNGDQTDVTLSLDTAKDQEDEDEVVETSQEQPSEAEEPKNVDQDKVKLGDALASGSLQATGAGGVPAAGFLFPKNNKPAGPDELKEEAEEAKAKLQDPRIYDTNVYHLPISHARKNSMTFLFFFVLIVGLAGY